MTKELLEKIKELEGKLGQGWMKELEGIDSVEVLQKKAADYDIELSNTNAEEALELMKDNGSEELSEEELSAVARRLFCLLNSTCRLLYEVLKRETE